MSFFFLIVDRTTHTSMGGRPITMESSTRAPTRLSTPYEYESLFKTSLNLKGMKDPRDTLREIERIGYRLSNLCKN